MKYAALDDETLIRQIAAAHTEALGALYDRYARLVFSLAYHTVGNYAAAEEITQDVFTNIWEKAATYRPDQGKVSTWLTSIARHRAIDTLRRQGARPERRSIDWAAAAPTALPRLAGPEDAVLAHLERQRVRSAVATLPEDQRLVLSLAFFEGKTHSEIAAELGQPLGTVKTRIRLAMQKLRQLLQDETVPAG